VDDEQGNRQANPLEYSSNGHESPALGNDDNVLPSSESCESAESGDVDDTSSDEYDSDGFSKNTLADDIRLGTRYYYCLFFIICSCKRLSKYITNKQTKE